MLTLKRLRTRLRHFYKLRTFNDRSLLSIVSAFETDLRAERQADGIKSAQKRSVKFGAKLKFTEEDTVKAIEMQSDGMLNQEIADSFGIARSTLLRHIANYKKSLEN